MAGVVQIPEQVEDLLATPRIQRACRLIGQKQHRPVDDGAGDCYPLPLAAAQPGRERAGLIGNAQLFQQILGPLFGSPSAHPGQLGRDEDVNAVMTSIGAAWQRLWSLPPFVADSALAFVLTVLAAAGGGSPAALLATVPLAWRRRQPLLVFGLVVVGAIVANGFPPYVIFAAIMVAAYSVGAYCPHRLLSLGALLGTAAGIVIAYGGALPAVPDFAGPFVILIPMWLVGNAIRIRQLRAEAFEDRATRLEREQEQATQAALAEERSRIARELHDVVAHSVSVMVVQAGAARQVLTVSPEEAREALLAVESSGREAMTELRNLLGLLNRDGVDIALAPQPGVGELESLIQRVGEAGLPVQLHIEGRPRPLPAGVDLAAYRIVQEALTNALKHSSLARTEVILDYRESELKVEVLYTVFRGGVLLKFDQMHRCA